MATIKRNWYSIVGGKRYVFVPYGQWKGGVRWGFLPNGAAPQGVGRWRQFLMDLSYVLSAFWCRFLGHVFDGSEVEYWPGGAVTCYCARCFSFRATLTAGETRFNTVVQPALKELQSVFGGEGPQQDVLLDGGKTDGETDTTD